MKTELFNKQFDRFILNNEELVNNYEDMFNESINDIMEDIKLIYNDISKITKINLKQLLQNSLIQSINTGNNILDTLSIVKNKLSLGATENNSIQKYFNEIHNIYSKNNNNFDIEYCPENRDILIQMNLKSVIAIAKNYQGLGVPVEDLISAGNVGLVTAFDRYDPSRAKLKDKMMNVANDLPDTVSNKFLMQAFGQFFNYGDIGSNFNTHFIKESYTKEEIIRWIKRNVRNAKFNSVATMWIQAYIIEEINNNSRLVKKPKIEIQQDKKESGHYIRENIVSMDTSINNDDRGMTYGELIGIQDDTISDMDISEAYLLFKQNLDLLLDGVKSRDREVVLKKFGIGIPRPMKPKEIAEQSGLSIARVSQIIQSVIEQMQANQQKYNIDSEVMYSALSKFL